MRWRDWTPWIDAVCERLPKRPLEVLEVGGGGKELAGFLARSGSELRLVNSPDGDICRHTRWEDGRFDLVLTKMGFEHFYDPFGAAREITRLLAPGGLLIVATVWSWRYHTAPGVEDYWRFSPVGLQQLFPRLRLVETGYDLSDRRKDCRLDNVAVDELGGWREHWYSYLVAEKPIVRNPAPSTTSHVFDLKWMNASLQEVRSAIPAILAAPDYGRKLTNVTLRPSRSSEDGHASKPLHPAVGEGGCERPDEALLGYYAFAAATFCRDVEVLEIGDNNGWGAFLAATYAHSVVAVTAAEVKREDLDVRGCEPRIQWFVDRGRTLDCLAGRMFDVVLLTKLGRRETEQEQIEQLERLTRVLRAGGVLVGFGFHGDANAAGLLAEDPDRKPDRAGGSNRMLELINLYFSRSSVIGDGVFIAVR